MMMRNTQTVLALAGVSGLMLAVIVGPSMVVAGSHEQCIGDWAKAAMIVERDKMVDVADLSKLARHKYDGRIMSARLCKGANSYFYRLVIRRDNGRVQRVKIDARKPLN